MRIILFLLLIFPAIMNAQINRSATEFAKENVEEYITTKLFKGNTYKPVSYGELRSRNERNSEIIWIMTHEFEISEVHTIDHKKIVVQRPYKVTFYFTEKMKVLKAESDYSG